MTTGQHNRKEEIVTAAFQTLMDEGLPMLSYDAIARHGGLSRQLIRYHYPDPEELMIDLLDHMAGVYREAMIAEVTRLQGTDRLRCFFDFYFDMIEGNPKPRDNQAYDAAMSLATAHPPIRATLRGQYSLLGQVLSHELELQYPVLGIQGAQELSWLFVCLMYGHWKMVASLGFAETHRSVTRAAIDRLVESYLARPSQPETAPRIWHTTT
ncbi:TetR/AcrR family transcriptional regulator [Vannielia litorea]|uniref:DNA-binding transcriptional regulator, AcrR family n=1 Tax=Vannielia litorea TaxID=1217970 RepID=A0A1N6FL63_9RHOB|nr:TetR/AcrR family transcriptional regulator [Vannielia litorea]SIN95991.1 DNA-binding transcriptional regulator, AcrR family [Vannielia litorea]